MQDVIFVMRDGVHPDMLGLLPGMLDYQDKRPSRQQFDEHYQHGGGWQPITGFKMGRRGELQYPGDHELRPIAGMFMPYELILFYEHALVAIVQKNGDFEVARMD